MSGETLTTTKYIAHPNQHIPYNHRIKPPAPPRQRSSTLCKPRTPTPPKPRTPKPPPKNNHHHIAIHKTYKSTTSLDTNSTISTHHSTTFPKQSLATKLPSPKRSIPDGLLSSSTNSHSLFPYQRMNRNICINNGYNPSQSSHSLSITVLPDLPQTPLPSPRTRNPHQYLKKTQSEQILYKTRSELRNLHINMNKIQIIDHNTYLSSSPGGHTSPVNNIGYASPVNNRGYTSRTSGTTRRRRHSSRSIRSNSTCSTGSNYSSYHRDSLGSNHGGNSPKIKSNIMCICGRRMNYTMNPMNKYPPNAVLYCQQSNKCKKKIVIAQDWFYCCKSRTSYHGTKDGKFKICFSCSISNVNKQERIRKNHQLLIKQLKSNHYGKVLITKDTKEYILSSTSANSKDETFKLLKQRYIDIDDKKAARRRKRLTSAHSHSHISRRKLRDNNIAHMEVDGKRYRIILEGFMMKKGNFWNKSFKKRYFKLLENKELYYYKSYENGAATDERGKADLNVINNMIKKGKNGLEIITPQREWKFLCNSNEGRDEWYNIVHKLSLGKKGKLLKAKTVNSIKT